MRKNIALGVKGTGLGVRYVTHLDYLLSYLVALSFICIVVFCILLSLRDVRWGKDGGWWFTDDYANDYDDWFILTITSTTTTTFFGLLRQRRRRLIFLILYEIRLSLPFSLAFSLSSHLDPLGWMGEVEVSVSQLLGVLILHAFYEDERGQCLLA